MQTACTHVIRFGFVLVALTARGWSGSGDVACSAPQSYGVKVTTRVEEPKTRSDFPSIRVSFRNDGDVPVAICRWRWMWEFEVRNGIGLVISEEAAWRSAIQTTIWAHGDWLILEAGDEFSTSWCVWRDEGVLRRFMPRDKITLRLLTSEVPPVPQWVRSYHDRIEVLDRMQEVSITVSEDGDGG